MYVHASNILQDGIADKIKSNSSHIQHDFSSIQNDKTGLSIKKKKKKGILHHVARRTIDRIFSLLL